MPLTPTFSVTPVTPHSYSYDHEREEWNHNAHLVCLGNLLDSVADWKLTDQCSQDKAVLGLNALAPPAPPTLPLDWLRYSGALLSFRTTATVENQYLLIYHVVGHRSIGDGPWPEVAFYLNGNFLRAEVVSGEEYIAILVDCSPAQTWWDVAMLVVGGFWAMIELKGIECYIL